MTPCPFVFVKNRKELVSVSITGQVNKLISCGMKCLEVLPFLDQVPSWKGSSAALSATSYSISLVLILNLRVCTRPLLLSFWWRYQGFLLRLILLL